jgi:hypothetical protein
MTVGEFTNKQYIGNYRISFFRNNEHNKVGEDYISAGLSTDGYGLFRFKINASLDLDLVINKCVEITNNKIKQEANKQDFGDIVIEKL